MSRTYRNKNAKPKPARRISVRAVRRSDPDLRPLGHALAQEALAQAAAEAAAASEPTPSEAEDPSTDGAEDAAEADRA